MTDPRERLEPCPFCGSEVEADLDDLTGLVTIGCDRPGCCILDTSYGTESEAIAAWNRRTPSQSREVRDAWAELTADRNPLKPDGWVDPEDDIVFWGYDGDTSGMSAVFIDRRPPMDELRDAFEKYLAGQGITTNVGYLRLWATELTRIALGEREP